jgi:hypothetical protein
MQQPDDSSAWADVRSPAVLPRPDTIRSARDSTLGVFIDPARGAALHRLRTVIVERVNSGQPVPCVQESGGWVSDDPKARSRAAWRCLDCAAFIACERYVDEHPERGGVWAGRGYSSVSPVVPYLERSEPVTTRPDDGPDCGSKPPDVSMGVPTIPRITRDTRSTKEVIMTSTTSTTGNCLCGCDEPTTRNYRPGHDARHVSNLVREVTGGTLDKRGALKALPTEPLREKFTRALGKVKAVAA